VSDPVSLHSEQLPVLSLVNLGHSDLCIGISDCGFNLLFPSG
jgi:hypothetical protein